MKLSTFLTALFSLVFLVNTAQAETLYFHKDHLGTPQTLTDKDQNVVWKASYTPFGEATITSEEVENNLRAPGQYFDKETGLHYNYFRTYDPATGRYIESDPIGLAAGVNTYGYVGQNPLVYIDPYGLNKRKWVNLGEGWTGGLDTFNKDGIAKFEIHVFDPAGREVGMYGPEGWFNKHGLTGRPDNVPIRSRINVRVTLSTLAEG